MFPKRSIAAVTYSQKYNAEKGTLNAETNASNTEKGVSKQNAHSPTDLTLDDLKKSLEKTAGSWHILDSEFSLGPGPSAAQLAAEVQKLDTDLVLLAGSNWSPTSKAISDLLYGYENGARVTIARRPANLRMPASANFTEAAWLYMFFGARRKDPSSPLRLYDTEGFLYILGVLEHYGEDSLPLYLLSAIEHYFTYRALGVEVSGWQGAESPIQVDFMKMIKTAGRLKSAIRKHNQGFTASNDAGTDANNGAQPSAKKPK